MLFRSGRERAVAKGGLHVVLEDVAVAPGGSLVVSPADREVEVVPPQDAAARATAAASASAGSVPRAFLAPHFPMPMFSLLFPFPRVNRQAHARKPRLRTCGEALKLV